MDWQRIRGEGVGRWPTEQKIQGYRRWNQGPVVRATTIMYFLSFIAFGSISLLIYNNNNNGRSIWYLVVMIAADGKNNLA